MQTFSDVAMYNGLKEEGFQHDSLKHSLEESLRNGEIHINEIESWSTLMRGHYGIYHKMSFKYLQTDLDEIVNRQKVRTMDMVGQLDCMMPRLVGKRLKYSQLARVRHGWQVLHDIIEVEFLCWFAHVCKRD